MFVSVFSAGLVGDMSIISWDSRLHKLLSIREIAC